MKAAIAVLLLLAHGAGADPFKKMPKKPAKLARALVKAIKADDVASFLALLPEDMVSLDRQVVKRSDVEATIAGGDLDVWLGTTDHWKARRDHAAWVIEDTRAELSFVIHKVDGAWLLNTIERPPQGDVIGHGDGETHVAAVTPSTILGKIQIVGKLDVDELRHVVARGRAKLTYCYEKELLATPTLTGTVTAVFTIGKGGAVTEAHATGMDPVDDCVANVFRTMTFSPPKAGDVVVTYPIHFVAAQ